MDAAEIWTSPKICSEQCSQILSVFFLHMCQGGQVVSALDFELQAPR